MKRIVARWETKGTDFLELYQEQGCYFYEGKGCGGTIGVLANDEAAINQMEQTAVRTLKSDRPSLKRVV